MATDKEIDAAVRRVKVAIGEIPVHGGGYIAVHQEHQRAVLRGSLLDQVAEIAAKAALDT